jgi:hypothetical protein
LAEAAISTAAAIAEGRMPGAPPCARFKTKGSMSLAPTSPARVKIPASAEDLRFDQVMQPSGEPDGRKCPDAARDAGLVAFVDFSKARPRNKARATSTASLSASSSGGIVLCTTPIPPGATAGALPL